jgi:hypothetical protein
MAALQGNPNLRKVTVERLECFQVDAENSNTE